MKRDISNPDSRAPDHAAPVDHRTIDRYGRVSENGGWVLLKRAMQAVPVTEFERSGR
jgi:hypothetical protein